LDGDITFNFSLFIELDACLKLSELGLFAFSESALGGSLLYKIRRAALKKAIESSTCSGRVDRWHLEPRTELLSNPNEKE